MGLKKWSVKEIDKNLARGLAEECDIDPIVALIAASRGYTDPAAIEEFLSDELCFDSPNLLADIDKAVEIINFAILNREKIAVFGDYDCDGVTATALLINYLRGRDADCVYYIPDRFEEGYGMNIAAVRKLADSGINLLITVDNGIMCHKEIEYAKSLGLTVVVTDHHLPSDTLPPADAIVDPHRADCMSGFKEICGAEVAFKLICVLEDREPEELLPYFADLLSLAVLADIMPLTFENRIIVKYGIHKLKTSPIIGLSAILNAAGIDKSNINASKIAFGIAPRINAAGRMGKADRAVELLLSDNMLKALGIAGELDNENTLRQQTEKKITAEAVAIIEKNGYRFDRIIVVEGNNWHCGVLGIVASRLTDRYGVPAVVLSVNGDIAEGSSRSIDGFSIYSAINSVKDLTKKFGGHTMAAGLTIGTDKISEFRKRINSYADSLPLTVPELKLDCRLNPVGLNMDLADALKQLEPYGNGNPSPVFGIYGVTLKRITPLSGGKHLRLLLSKGENTFQALLFGVSPEKFCFNIGDVLDVAITVESSIYNGEENLSVLIKAVRISGTDDERLFSELDNLNKFFSGKKYNTSVITPTREEVGVIFKQIISSPVLEDRIKYLNLSSLGLAKTVIAITALEELGLIIKDNKGVLSTAGLKVKTDLKNSPTYKQLIEGSETV